jgi:simple sugar transport system ATP-binding protein
MLDVSLRELTKTFSGIRAVDKVTINFHAGEIHAILGENGAGKSTLMHLLSGLYRPDAGEIHLNNIPQSFSSVRTARAAGITMVHQHFMLVPTLTIAENLLLALPGKAIDTVKKQKLVQHVSDLATQYGISIDNPNALVSTLSVGVQQRVEILKALAINARVLILDEPTAVLTLHEVTTLFDSLQKLKNNGYLILLITHKIPEVLAVSDRLSVLRRGQLITTKETKACSPAELASLMVGDQKPLHPLLPEPAVSNVPAARQPSSLLTLQNISVKTEHGNWALQNVSLMLQTQQIIGIAGVDGNGQAELAEVIIGLRTPTAGTLYLKDRLSENPTPAKFRAAGVAIIPQDRRREGLALNMTVSENLLLNTTLLSRLIQKGLLFSSRLRQLAIDLMTRFSIVPPIPRQPVSTLSGGNQQRVVIARELSTSPQIIIAANPSRGLDVRATRDIHYQFQKHRANGAGIILISTDLDEIITLSDYLYVLYHGSLLGPVAPTSSREQIGQMMGGSWKSKK